MPASALLQPRNMAKPVLECFHCHEKCEDDRLKIEDKVFCCDGCRMVYEILDTHGLCNYYNLDEKQE